MASSATPAAVRWSSIIDRLEASGQTLREFAAANDLNRKTLEWWRRKLGRSRPRSGRKAAFTELVVTQPQSKPIAIALDSYAARVVVDDRTDLSLVRRVLEALC